MMKLLSFVADVDPARLQVTTRTAVASCMALGLATMIGLDHPQWAAMTVWITALPTRGQRLERSLARIAGTILGALAGVCLMAISGDSPIGIVLGLTLWIGLCAGMGNSLTGSASYVSLLAGYSAAMLALLGFGHGEPLWWLAFDRVATICLGGLVGTAIALICSIKPQPRDIGHRLNQLVHACLDHMIGGGLDETKRLQLISKISAIDESVDISSAGSLRARRQGREVRNLLSALTRLLLDDHCRREIKVIQAPLKKPSQGEDISGDPVIRMVHLAARWEDSCSDRSERLKALIPLLQRARQATDAPTHPADAPPPLPLHRDWIGARRAALRSAGAVALTGVLWIMTGWTLGPYMVMGAAIMTSVFSTFPDPGLQMRWVIGGSLAGALTAIVGHTLIMPMASGAGIAALLTMPLVLLGAPIMAHRRIGLAGMEYNLIYLLMMNPNLPIDPLLSHAMLQAFAVVLGPISAFLAFLVIPVNAGLRLDFVIRLIVHELIAMAKGAYVGQKRGSHWQMRAYHRLMLLVRLGERSGRGNSFAASGAMSAFEMGEALQTMHGMAAGQDLKPHEKRPLRAALLSVNYISRTPERVEQAFRRAARALEFSHPGEAARLEKTATRVAANRDFFRRAA